MNFRGEIKLTLVKRTSWEQAKEKTFVMVQAGTEERTHTRAGTGQEGAGWGGPREL